MLDVAGALAAVVLGAVVTFALQRRHAQRERSDLLLRRYLAQLQDACESLWFRLRNLAYERADLEASSEYLVTTTMYTLGRALGIERMLALEGLYPEIWKRYPSLSGALTRRILDTAVGQTTNAAKEELQHYDRVTLAEAVVERDGETFRQSTFLEFRRRVESQGEERIWWQPARESVAMLNNSQDVVAPLMATLKKLAIALADVTTMETQLKHEQSQRDAKRASHTGDTVEL